jgi:hypothetical protein
VTIASVASKAKITAIIPKDLRGLWHGAAADHD